MQQYKIIPPKQQLAPKGPMPCHLMQLKIKAAGTAKHKQILSMLQQMRNRKELTSGLFNARVKNLYKQVMEQV